MILIEAKAYGSWGNAQLTSRLNAWQPSLVKTATLSPLLHRDSFSQAFDRRIR
jgi:hypothetical protein